MAQHISWETFRELHRIAAESNWNISSAELGRRVGISRTAAAKWRLRTKHPDGSLPVNDMFPTTTPAPVEEEELPIDAESDKPQAAVFKSEVSRRVVVVTWAQNATPLHMPFFRALQAYTKSRDGQLIVIAGRYKNPTSQWTASQANEERWAPELVPYLCNVRHSLNSNLELIGDVKTQPTATSPLTGFESLTHGESGIFGHPKLQMKVVPTPQHSLPKILTTTGAVTIPNYTDSKAGKKGEFHHVQGAVVIEIQDDRVFHLRHINATDNGTFVDMDKMYFPNGKVTKAGPYKGLVFGDAHYRFADPDVVEATFGKNGLVSILNPDILIWHDLLDSYAVNPHHEGNPFISVAKNTKGFNDIRREIEETVEWLIDKTGKRLSVVVPSNHDDMVTRWLMRKDWRSDPVNAEFYLETALHMVRSVNLGERGTFAADPFQYWLTKLNKNRAEIYSIPPGESFQIADIECSLHGHQGPHGARGSVKNLSQIGTKVISGHGHVPAIEAGHYRTGTMTPLSLEYSGPVGAWLNTHCSIDPLGKRHLHTVINGRFSISS